MSNIFNSDDVAHVVVSCQNRNTVEIYAPVKLSKELLEESLKISQKSLVEVLSLNVVEDSTNEYIHTLVFISYSHELCNKLKGFTKLRKINSSNRKLWLRKDLTASDLNFIKDFYKNDFKFFEKLAL